jgi:hypothetical protein
MREFQYLLKFPWLTSMLKCLLFLSVCPLVCGRPKMAYNGLQLQEVGDFEIQTFF